MMYGMECIFMKNKYCIDTCTKQLQIFTLIVPATLVRHTGHWVIAAEHCTQHTKCDLGKKIIPTTASQHILHVSCDVAFLTIWLLLFPLSPSEM